VAKMAKKGTKKLFKRLMSKRRRRERAFLALFGVFGHFLGILGTFGQNWGFQNLLEK
jgi:hypothetical protein